MPYRRRVIDDELDELLSGLPAVALEGPRGVGKTATGTQRAARVYSLDDPAVAEIVTADLTQVDATGGTALIDEWQHYPPVWDYVRRRVDAGAAPGSYLLAGSAAPTDPPVHSGAGRIVSLRMRPFSLAERGLGEAPVSLRAMLTGETPTVGGTSSVGLRDYTEEILASGLPGVRSLPARLRRAQLDGYLRRVIEHDFPEQGLRVRRPETLLGWLRAYAAATATTTDYSTLLNAATPGVGAKPAKTTTAAYRDVLAQLWLLDPLPGWGPSKSAVSRLTYAPKHHLADPALTARLLTVDADTLLSGGDADPAVPREGTLLGSLFESLVALSIRVYAQAAEADAYHLRTREGRHEVDLIIEAADRGVVALEVKLSATVADKDVQHLIWLRDQLGDRLRDAAVVTTGRYAYRRRDGIAVIPAALLGA